MNYSDNPNREKHSKVSEHSPGASVKNKRDFNSPAEEQMNDQFPDYPVYPPDEDIYSIYKKEEEVDIEHPFESKNAFDKTRPLSIRQNEEDYYIANDLDIPGAELDDDQEIIGSEDEENNYYSLGGDNHEDLDENTGEDYD